MEDAAASVDRGPRVRQAAQRAGAQRATESQEHLKKEEKELIEAVKERAAVRAEQEERRKKRERRKPFNIPQGQNVTQLSISPDEKYVIASVSQTATGTKSSIVPNYVTESGYTEDIPARSKVGDAQNRIRLGVFDVATGDVKWVDHGQRLAESPRAVTESGEGQPRRGTRRRGTRIGTSRTGCPPFEPHVVRRRKACSCPGEGGRQQGSLDSVDRSGDCKDSRT